jgi:ferredoxin
MGCSFKHKGEFIPSVSAIKVLDKGNGRGFFISLAEESKGNNSVCVACRECARYCPTARDLEKIIEKFKQKK